MRNLRIFRHLRRDMKFGHLGQGNFLLHLTPLGKEVLNLLRHRLLSSRYREKQNHLWTRGRQQLPRSRRRRRLLARQSLRQAFSILFQIFPGFDQILARNRLAQVGHIFIT